MLNMCNETYFPNIVNGWKLLNDCNGTWTHNHLVGTRTLNHLAKLAPRYSHLSFRYWACFEQGVSWYPGNYGVWILFKTRTWHVKNIQLKTINYFQKKVTSWVFGRLVNTRLLVVFVFWRIYYFTRWKDMRSQHKIHTDKSQIFQILFS